MHFCKHKKLCQKGQSLLEALFVVIFTTVIMFVFIQICIITVDDMIANEAAFVAMRSAAVTETKWRSKEVQDRVKNYFMFFYPTVIFGKSNFNPSHFVFSDKKTVEKYLRGIDSDNEVGDETVITDDNFLNPEDSYASIWRGEKTTKDYSGRSIAKETVKIYYFTRVLFGYLVSNSNSFRNKRFQSARNRMFPSPDEDYYYKAFPGARKFEQN